MASQQHIRVKFIYRGLSKETAPQWLRMFPGHEPIWGSCHFIFDLDESNYDWLVIYNDLPINQGQARSASKQTVQCPKQNTLLITTEPSSISTYGTDFLNQFGHILTGQENWAIKHPGKIHSQPALCWFYGNSMGTGKLLDYDFMEANPPENKSKTISTVCSAKAQKHTMHYKRVQFVEKMCKALPELDRFGWGIKEIDDKAETLAPYRYHIAIENHICDHWWTEKLSDAFLGMTLPFYHGAPNADEYFPKDSFIPINIFDFEGSLKIIRHAIKNGEYEKRQECIRSARKLVLEKYNTFAVISKIIEERHDPSLEAVSGYTIMGRHTLRRNPLIAIHIILEKIWMRIQSLLNK